MARTIVTTSHKPDTGLIEKAVRTANCLDVSFVERERMPFEMLREKYSADNILVVSREDIRLYTPSGEYSFHPSMSVPRIKAMRQGKTDQMADAMSLKHGDHVLDCTLGLGADAIVAAFAAGPQGKVVGIEASCELAYMVRNGLKEYQSESKVLLDAMTRIEVIAGESFEYLSLQPDNSFDIVYFDPMFRFPRTKSSSMEPLRGVMNQAPLSPEMIKEGTRVARNRVVMKENWFSKEFARLGFNKIAGGKYSPVAFGIIDKQGGEE